MKVLLINPPLTQNKKSQKRCLVHMGLAYIAAVLENNGFPVKILDCVVEGYDVQEKFDEKRITFGLTGEEIRRRIEEYEPDIVGVSCLMSMQSHNAHRMCEIAKEVNPNIETVMGGPHPAAMVDETLRDTNVDRVVVGEGEMSMLEIVSGRAVGKVVSSPPMNLENLPMPARHLLPMEKYLKINMPLSTYAPSNRVIQIETSRGCSLNCCFCTVKNFWGKWRRRPPIKVLSEVRFLIDRYKVEELDIIDSNFAFNREYLVEILNGLVGLGLKWANAGGIWVGGLDEEILDLMRQSGCYQLSLAVESATPSILHQVIHKPIRLEKVKPLVKYCHKIGIDTHAFFVTGFPEESVEDMKRNYEFAKECGFSSASFHIITPFPGSDIYEKYPITDYVGVEMRNVNIHHPELSDQELERLVDGFNRRFNRSLLWRNPRRFFSKYGGNFIRRRKVFFGRQ